MAFDKEFLAQHFQGREDAEERINAIMAEYEKANLPLTKNRDDILTEKKAAEKKLAELIEKHFALETANKELNEKLESGLPDKEKQIYKAEIENLKRTIGNLNEENGKMKTDYEGKIGQLSAEKHNYIIGQEFAKLIDADPAIYPESKEDLAKSFFVDYPKSEFELYDYGGKQKYVNKAGKTMDDLLAEKLGKPGGKIYRMNTNNGGGATGGAKTNTGSGMSRQHFDALSPAQKADYIKEGGKIHD